MNYWHRKFFVKINVGQISTHVQKACVQKQQVSVTSLWRTLFTRRHKLRGRPKFFFTKGHKKPILLADLRVASARIAVYIAPYIIIMYILKVKVKISLYRHGQALEVLGCCVSQTSIQSPHKGGTFVSYRHRPPLPAQEIFLVLICVRGWGNFIGYT